MNTSLPTGQKGLPFVFKLWRAFSKYWPTLPIRNIIKWGTYKTPQDPVLRGYEAPFPDEKYKAGARAWPSLVPSNPNDDGVKQLRRAKEVLKTWDKPALVMFSEDDPITKPAERWFLENIPTVKDEPEIIIERAGHFLQEDQGKKLAEHIHDFILRSHARERGEEIVLDPEKYPTKRR
jgi:haloalkane dehalogenase